MSRISILIIDDLINKKYLIKPVETDPRFLTLQELLTYLCQLSSNLIISLFCARAETRSRLNDGNRNR